MILDNITIKVIPDSVERFEMPDEDYFAMDAVSNSKLKLLNPDEGGSPSHFFASKFDKKSDAMELGSAVHQLLLEKDSYFLSDFQKPGGKVGSIFKMVHDLTTRENPLDFDEALGVSCKVFDYYADSLTDKRLETLKEKGSTYLNFLKEESKPGQIVLTADQRDKCIQCVSSIKKNSFAYDLLYPKTSETVHSHNEDVIVMDIKGIIKEEIIPDRDVVIKLKSKIDNWSVDLETNIITLNDLKTSGKPVEFFPGRKVKNEYSFKDDLDEIFIEGSFQKYRYYRQMAFYGCVLRNYCNKLYGKRNWTMNINMIVVETFGLHKAQVFRVGNNWIELGMKEFRSLLKRVVYHTINGLDKVPELEGKDLFIIE